jgi:RNA polymerase sigma-70 factor (ECF subfamily)
MDELDGWLAEAYPAAYRTAGLILRSPVDAQDAVQEALLRVWRFRAAIPNGEARRAWLYRVVVNACLSRLRAERHWQQRGDDGPLAQLASRANTEREVEDAALAQCMRAALERLPERLRVPVVLRYYTGLAEREIAVAIQRRPGTVKSRLSEARQLLAADPALAEWQSSGLEVAR